ncbi:MAG: DoxX family membrane protein [Puniceicoccaceae bacterium]|nr:MAG: DoxX family membrane protein [Puniceicoccaceae bacterium]
MKIAVAIIRILLGVLFLFASVAYFLNLVEPPELEGAMEDFSAGLAASGYVFTVIKTLELLCGLAFVSGIFVPLATVLIFPVTVNILFVHLFLDPAGLPVAVFVTVANLFLAYACRKHYRLLFSSKIQPA